MKVKETIAKDKIYCDRCGKEIKGESCFFFTAYGNASYTSDVVPVFESKIGGDYCQDCNKIISRVFKDLVSPVFKERYQAANDTTIWDYAEQHDLSTDKEY
jgi:hypothetical protein